MLTKKSLNNSLESDTIELFSREDIIALDNKRQKRRTYQNLTVLSLILVLIIAISTISLIRFGFSGYDLELTEPNTSTTGDNEPIFDFDSNKHNKEHNKHHKHHIPVEVVYPTCDNIEDSAKFDCNPDQPISEDVCLSRGCCWNTRNTTKINNKYNNPPLNVPFCYFGTDYIGYEVSYIENYLYRTVVTLKRNIASGFVRDSQSIKLEITELNEHSVRLKFYDPMQRRYEVPIPKLNITTERTIDKSLFEVKVTKNGLLEINRRLTETPIFRTDLKRLVFSDQFLQMSSDLPSKYIYGIGEHKDGFRKEATWKRYTLFNRDQPPVANISLYGSHPFYLSVEDSLANSNGVFLFNSNAMDVILQPKPAITWRTIGGILDFYVFLGPKPSDVVRQYIQLIGLPTFPPYWALGFHLCRYGYKNTSDVMAVFNRTREAQIPYDVQWTDIDAMKADNDFTYDDKNFAKLPEFVDHLHQIGMKYIPMFDPGISASEKPGTYAPYDEGMALNIFVKNESGLPFIGKVWNKGSTVWPDFTDPKAIIYWSSQFAKFHKIIEYDGSWIDMNEPSNFLDGAVNGCPQNSLENPQYTPGANNDPLRHRTFCMNAKHYLGLHYDLHNLFGFSEAIVTNIALRAVRKKREIIISRSTFPGHGKYASHWNGDIYSEWESMRWTIPSILNFNLFGIPMIGADICGFNGDTTVELCARWSALGAFYPFARNHNSDSSIDQDPVSLGPEVVAAAKNALELRYSLLPYFYTLFFKAHIYGDTVVRPLFFEFPEDVNSYTIETQFLWGSAVMVVPTLYPNATSVNTYLPPGLWYDIKNITNAVYNSKGEYVTLASPLTSINLLLRSGHIIVTQNPKTTTEETRKEDFILTVGLDSEGKAVGDLFWDSGDGLDNLVLREYDIFEFFAQNNTLRTLPIHYGYEINLKLSKTLILGVKSRPIGVTINGVQSKDYNYSESNQLLTIYNINGLMSRNNTIVWK